MQLGLIRPAWGQMMAGNALAWMVRKDGAFPRIPMTTSAGEPTPAIQACSIAMILAKSMGWITGHPVLVVCCWLDCYRVTYVAELVAIVWLSYHILVQVCANETKHRSS